MARTGELGHGRPVEKKVIAAHACQKYSGRVGRSASAKDLNEDAVRLAVVAHIRHAETSYDDLLMTGMDRHEARPLARGEIDKVLTAWQAGR